MHFVQKNQRTRQEIYVKLSRMSFPQQKELNVQITSKNRMLKYITNIYKFIHVPIDHLMYELDTLHISVFFHADAIDIVLHTKAGIDVITQPYNNPRRWSINYGNHVHTPLLLTRG